jgi:hypothetical protein
MTMKRLGILLAAPVLALAGGLRVEVGTASANPEAKALGATLVARVVACHEPGRSKLTASAVRVEGDRVMRQALRIAPLREPGVFAVIGAAPDATVEIGVSNPEFDGYRPHLLVRTNREGIEWSSLRRFGGQPVMAEVRAAIQP